MTEYISNTEQDINYGIVRLLFYNCSPVTFAEAVSKLCCMQMNEDETFKKASLEKNLIYFLSALYADESE